jgi:hypothetical protein
MIRSITLTFTYKDNEAPDDEFIVAKQGLIDFIKDQLAVLDFENLRIE